MTIAKTGRSWFYWEVEKPLERVMKSFCGKYKYAGESGSGYLAKLMMNFIGLYNIAAYAQTFRLTERMGLDSRVLEELIPESGLCLDPTI